MKKQTVLPQPGEADGWRYVVSDILDRCPNDGMEAVLDVHQLTLFQIDPPAFLLRSVK